MSLCQLKATPKFLQSWRAARHPLRLVWKSHLGIDLLLPHLWVLMFLSKSVPRILRLQSPDTCVDRMLC